MRPSYNLLQVAIASRLPQELWKTDEYEPENDLAYSACQCSIMETPRILYRVYSLLVIMNILRNSCICKLHSQESLPV